MPEAAAGKRPWAALDVGGPRPVPSSCNPPAATSAAILARPPPRRAPAAQSRAAWRCGAPSRLAGTSGKRRLNDWRQQGGGSRLGSSHCSTPAASAGGAETAGTSPSQRPPSPTPLAAASSDQRRRLPRWRLLASIVPRNHTPLRLPLFLLATQSGMAVTLVPTCTSLQSGNSLPTGSPTQRGGGGRALGGGGRRTPGGGGRGCAGGRERAGKDSRLVEDRGRQARSAVPACMVHTPALPIPTVVSRLSAHRRPPLDRRRGPANRRRRAPGGRGRPWRGRAPQRGRSAWRRRPTRRWARWRRRWRQQRRQGAQVDAEFDRGIDAGILVGAHSQQVPALCQREGEPERPVVVPTAVCNGCGREVSVEGPDWQR